MYTYNYLNEAVRSRKASFSKEKYQDLLEYLNCLKKLEQQRNNGEEIPLEEVVYFIVQVINSNKQ